MERPGLTLAKSAVFGETVVDGGTSMQIQTYGQGRFMTKIYNYDVLLSGASYFHDTTALETKTSSWITIPYSDNRRLSAYFQSKSASWDFADNSIAEWTQIKSGVATSFSVGSGKVNCINTSTNKQRGILYLPSDYNDFAPTLQCEIKQKDNNVDYYGGLAFNITDINNFNFVEISTGGGHIGKCLAGTITGQATWTQTLTYNNYYTLRVEVSTAGVVSAYIDDVLKSSYDYGAAFTSKPVGLFYRNDVATANLDTDYDDFSTGTGGQVYGINLMFR